MKQFFKESKKIKARHALEIASMCAGVMILIGATLFIGGRGIFGRILTLNHIYPGMQTADWLGCSLYGCGGADAYSYGVTSNVTTVSSGQPVTFTWQAMYYQGGATNTEVSGCYSSGQRGQPLNYTPCSTSTTGAYDSSHAFGNGGNQYTPINGTYTAYPTASATYYFCSLYMQGWGPSFGYSTSYCPSVYITVAAACPASGFGSPWNSNSYLIYSGGQGSISNWYGRYCVHNYSGSAIFIPMSTPTEWNNFTSSAPNIGVGISAY